MINYNRVSWLTVIMSLLFFYLLAVISEAEEADDPVVDFYWKKVKNIRKSRDPIETGTKYSYMATSFYKKIDHKGRVENIDSVRSEYFYSWGQLDSSKTLAGSPRKFKNLDLQVPDIFETEYIRYFFPNDTAETDLAIGFDTDSASNPSPVGLLIIDRSRYLLRWLYLFYPMKEKYQRFSRSYRFVEVEGLIFPDSIWEVGSIRGIFSSENYRIETAINSIKIYRGQ